MLVVSDGQLVMQGTPREIFTQVDKMRELHLDVPPMTDLDAQLRAARNAAARGHPHRG